MADESQQNPDVGDNPAVPSNPKKGSGTNSKRQRGVLSRIWNGIFRSRNEDFEKRLQHLSKEEALVLSRLKRRARTWRKMAKYTIVFSVILEVAAVVYAIVTTRSLDLNWKMRAVRVLPMFVLPALSSIFYSTLASLTKMCDRKDQKILERLRAERQEKIDELKERTNYYITQQLIQRYDPDPAAKAAAASVLASKLGADSGLKVYLGDESKLNMPQGKSNDVEYVQSNGLRNRKQSHARNNSSGSGVMQQLPMEMPHGFGHDGEEVPTENQTVVVGHHQGLGANDGGWFARIAALLVGDDPSQSYALICGNCHMHNGLVPKEDFPMPYYCKYCHALNGSRQSGEEHDSGSTSNMVSPPTSGIGGTISNAGSVSESEIISNLTSVLEAEEGGEVKESSLPAN
eukprot:TRINITY_DN772_c0_g1_i3.p1 TRINITY_DN772_c0_g1~~TRINITY_DN772_c0_g1_i3.p1  ORF type:complete len:402 (-),score=79.92 TRINITY_DN772_c0_g1_i3:274-1479(-)